MKFSDESSYDGEWKNDFICGTGFMKYKSGEYYKGEWVNNKREGFGELIEKTVIYMGEWKDDKKHGNGKNRVCYNTINQ